MPTRMTNNLFEIIIYLTLIFFVRFENNEIVHKIRNIKNGINWDKIRSSGYLNFVLLLFRVHSSCSGIVIFDYLRVNVKY